MSIDAASPLALTLPLLISSAHALSFSDIWNVLVSKNIAEERERFRGTVRWEHVQRNKDFSDEVERSCFSESDSCPCVTYSSPVQNPLQVGQIRKSQDGISFFEVTVSLAHVISRSADNDCVPTAHVRTPMFLFWNFIECTTHKIFTTIVLFMNGSRLESIMIHLCNKILQRFDKYLRLET